jgi:phosphopantothenoylcysteine decarboxylase/phosphopantothenate--cysteine ligase
MVAPAMNTHMLAHPTVLQNIETLRKRGVEIIEPVNGLLACGEEGAGKMPDVPVLVDIVKSHFQTTQDLKGRTILVTAGPTREPIDPVRYISNRSSGKMGYAIAEAARKRGASVTLVSGPTALEVPFGVEVTRVVTAEEMHAAVLAAAPQHQIVIKAAAVSDFAPRTIADRKIKKSDGVEELTLTLKRNPDILSDVARLTPRPFIVAFAAETEAVEANAREKLLRKGADLIVANDVKDASIGFDSDQNEVLVIAASDGSATRIAKSAKSEIANRLLDVIVARMK